MSMHQILGDVAAAIAAVLQRELPQLGQDWWQSNVVDRLSIALSCSSRSNCFCTMPCLAVILLSAVDRLQRGADVDWGRANLLSLLTARVSPAWAADAGLDGLDLTLGPLPYPDSAGPRQSLRICP